MRGQVTIEFILILVIMLVILATISLPAIENMEVEVKDTGLAITTAAIQQRLLTASKELQLSGCGSQKTITVHLDENNCFTPAKIEWNETHIFGAYMTIAGDQMLLKEITYPEHISLVGSTTSSLGYWDVTVKKDCSATVNPIGYIGDGCP